MPSNLTSTDARITYTSKPHKLATKHRRCTGRHAKQSSTEASITPQEERRFLARRAQETEQRRALFNVETDAETTYVRIQNRFIS
jgi:hypothetical protein